MIINYNVSGSDRKQLVAAIAEHTGEKAKYLGAPGFAYQIGGFTVSVNGKVTIEDNSTAAPLIRFLREKGFQAEDPLANINADDAAEEQIDTDGPCGICISMPRSLFTDGNLENLKALIAAKGNLIKKALGVDDLPIEATDEKVSFPWFPAVPTPEELKAYDTFICKLCEMARNAKRVVAKEKETDNDKYAFRCFLLRLGFIGAEFKTERKILLRNLAGSSAFKSGQPKEVEVCE
ncbi:MAG: virulence protein [Oscillospiraceae bacterium]|nr:virulence protein [Oscillospiraceae bacterium]